MKGNEMKKIMAFTLAEIVLTLGIVSILIGLMSSKVMRQSPDIEKTKVKKAYIVVERTINSLINNEVLYPNADMLMRDLTPVITSVGDRFGNSDDDGVTKFRDGFKYYLDILEEDISCTTQLGNSDNCFRTADGIVFGIPDTDFVEDGVSNFTDDTNRAAANNLARTYVPVTVYPKWEKNGENDFRNDTMVIGVRFDGQIRILNNDRNCPADNNKRLACRLESILQSDDIKRNN